MSQLNRPHKNPVQLAEICSVTKLKTGQFFKLCSYFNRDTTVADLEQTHKHRLLYILVKSTVFYIAPNHNRLSHDTCHIERVKTTLVIYRDPTFLHGKPRENHQEQGDCGEKKEKNLL